MDEAREIAEDLVDAMVQLSFQIQRLADLMEIALDVEYEETHEDV